jgi:hypothetical protein
MSDSLKTQIAKHSHSGKVALGGAHTPSEYRVPPVQWDKVDPEYAFMYSVVSRRTSAVQSTGAEGGTIEKSIAYTLLAGAVVWGTAGQGRGQKTRKLIVVTRLYAIAPSWKTHIVGVELNSDGQVSVPFRFDRLRVEKVDAVLGYGGESIQKQLKVAREQDHEQVKEWHKTDLEILRTNAAARGKQQVPPPPLESRKRKATAKYNATSEPSTTKRSGKRSKNIKTTPPNVKPPKKHPSNRKKPEPTNANQQHQIEMLKLQLEIALANKPTPQPETKPLVDNCEEQFKKQIFANSLARLIAQGKRDVEREAER